MSLGTLKISKKALIDNLKKLQRLSTAQTGAVVKANSYGLGTSEIVKILASNGVNTFFVAIAKEAKAIREALGNCPKIYVFSGHSKNETSELIRFNARPILNSVEQIEYHKTVSADLPFAIQLETGINRLGVISDDWRHELACGADFLMSHLACADQKSDKTNKKQLDKFLNMTAGLNIPRSLSATAGILLGKEYHFDLTRPGIGLYGGYPFTDSNPVISLDIPVIQIKIVKKGESVGYGASYIVKEDTKVATINAGYADGIFRNLSDRLTLFHEGTRCHNIGRISMDLITVDITHLKENPKLLTLIGPQQSIDQLGRLTDTIGHEVLTSLGSRYKRLFV
jgi:alanine racemase